jgi:hypothetical protein
MALVVVFLVGCDDESQSAGKQAHSVHVVKAKPTCLINVNSGGQDCF